MGTLSNASFCVAALLGATAYVGVLCFLYEHSEVKALTHWQYGMAFMYTAMVALWLGAEAGFYAARHEPQYASVAEDEQDLVDESEKESQDKSTPKSPSPPKDAAIFGIPMASLPALRYCGEFVAIMSFIYLCDRTTIVAKGPKYVNPTAFWSTCALILVAALFTLRGGHGSSNAPAAAAVDHVHAHVKPLQRDQTEEWKGWMQIMFVLYHYFAEAEIYNAIRMYIAAYVWMTGFGNFSYYYIKADFSAVRFAQMMWRLNFFVIFVCLTMNNEYMLYYICPMHTFFTFGVFFPLYAFNSYNGSFKVLLLKIVLTFGLAVVLYDIPGVFTTLMEPLAPLLAFHDPLHKENSPMHEWFFRSGLDHLVWVFGMFCAWAFPWLDSKLEQIESLPSSKRTVAKGGLLAVTLAIGAFWLFDYFLLAKRQYNKVHPYTSFIPIFLYLVLRNFSETLRSWHMHLFAWCGKITLETYILQFHVWMKTTGINGSPKYLMVWLPYYWLNFIVVTVVYVVLSYRVFIITAALRDTIIPKEGGAALAKRIVVICLVFAATWGAGALIASRQ